MLSGISSRLTRLKRLSLPVQLLSRRRLQTRTRSLWHPRPAGSGKGLTSARWIAWWGPPRQGWDDGEGSGGDEYVYRMKLEQGGRAEYQVKVEGREVVVKGRVVDSTPNRRYEQTFSRTHLLPEDVDLSTVRLRFNQQGDLVITARFYK